MCLVTTFVTPGLPTMRIGGISITSSPIRAGRIRCYPAANSLLNLLTSHQRRVNLAINHKAEPQVNTYPASEQRISEIERGVICNAILPMPGARTLSADDSIIFALAYFHAGQDPFYVKNADSVCVSLTEVIDLGETDPATGQALFRLSWKPLGQSGSPGTIAKRVVMSRIAHRRG